MQEQRGGMQIMSADELPSYFGSYSAQSCRGVITALKFFDTGGFS